MTAQDISGAILLFAAAVIAATELLLTAYVWSLPPLPERERPSALPSHREAE